MRRLNILDINEDNCEELYTIIKSKAQVKNNYELISFIDLALDLGMKTADILKLKWDQIDFENKVIRDAYLTKASRINGKNITIDVQLHDMYFNHDYILSDLQQWYNRAEDKIKIFPNMRWLQMSDKLRGLTGLNNIYAHQLRYLGVMMKMKNINLIEN